MMGQPLDLNFKEFEALVLFISVLLAALMVQVKRCAQLLFAVLGNKDTIQPSTGMPALFCGRQPCMQSRAMSKLRQNLHAVYVGVPTAHNLLCIVSVTSAACLLLCRMAPVIG
jgi:hypothetical protein